MVQPGLGAQEPDRAQRRIRQKNPTYSAKKIRPILLRYYEEHEVPCRSTISNVIKRHNFFFRADTKPFKRRSKSGVRAFERRRIKGNFRAAEPNRVIEFDMKHIRIPNNGKKYAMVAIDVVAKQAVIHVSNTCTSASGKIAYQKAVARFGRDAVYVNDNGGENQGNTYTQVAASVREPQTLQRELCPLQAMRDNYPKFLLTLDDDPESDYQGILRRNALQWLVEG